MKIDVDCTHTLVYMEGGFKVAVDCKSPVMNPAMGSVTVDVKDDPTQHGWRWQKLTVWPPFIVSLLEVRPR